MRTTGKKTLQHNASQDAGWSEGSSALHTAQTMSAKPATNMQCLDVLAYWQRLSKSAGLCVCSDGSLAGFTAKLMRWRYQTLPEKKSDMSPAATLSSTEHPVHASIWHSPRGTTLHTCV